jgi:hypothetical protein
VKSVALAVTIVTCLVLEHRAVRVQRVSERNGLHGLPRRAEHCTNDSLGATDTGFAGHCDWRLPTLEELRTLVDLTAPGCGTGSPCIDATFGPSNRPYYWSSARVAFNASFAWVEEFNYGGSTLFPRTGTTYARAVRRAF